MTEAKKIEMGFESGVLKFGIDSNKDGQKSIEGKLHLNEALEEIIKKGTAIEGAKVVSFGFEAGKLKLAIDTDKDGEKLLELEIDLAEGFDEATGMFKK